jgi:hypothetical protein
MDNPLTEPERFQAWAENPLTVAYRQFLKDWQRQMADQWAEGFSLTPEQQAEAATVGALSRLDCDQVRKFYDMDEVTGDNDRN